MILLIGKNKGILLLEVLVSVTILSVCLVLIISSFARAIRATDLSEDYFRAGLLLEEKIFEVSYSDVEEGFSEGKRSDFLWALDIVKAEEDFFYEASLKISWDRGAKEHSLDIVTYL
ncbi:MAG: hypothetical protein KKD11_01470 [Candidatus Omnitrophica bacterium]|nr:hypothetical protein [Candidatus Omnitrophota bacterium]